MLVQNVARQSKLAEFVAECVEEIDAHRQGLKQTKAHLKGQDTSQPSSTTPKEQKRMPVVR